MRQITKEELCALDADARRAAFRAMNWRERQSFAFGFCGNPNAEFPSVLVEYLEVDWDGDVSLSYPRVVGSHSFYLREIDDRLAKAMRFRRAKERAAALAEAANWVADARAEHDLIDFWWKAHLDALDAQSVLRRAA